MSKKSSENPNSQSENVEPEKGQPFREQVSKYGQSLGEKQEKGWGQAEHKNQKGENHQDEADKQNQRRHSGLGYGQAGYGDKFNEEEKGAAFEQDDRKKQGKGDLKSKKNPLDKGEGQSSPQNEPE